MESVIPIEHIDRLILLIRGQKVILSADLAVLYGVEPRALVQAVKRNIESFPGDFMFQLSREETANLKSQPVISSWGGRRASPYAFTQEGVAMLSAVLQSRTAVQVKIAIMRAFVRMREMVYAQKEFARRLAEIEGRVDRHDVEIKRMFDAFRESRSLPATPPPRKIGFHP